MYEIPSLLYKYADLEPYLDEATMKIHHLGHHQAYADKTNVALEKYVELKEQSLPDLIYNPTKLPEDIRSTIVNNGGGYLNHNFWWKTLAKPKDDNNLPAGTTVGVQIDEQWGDYNNFKTAFKDKALSLFGSGWTWLSAGTDGKLEFLNTANQGLPPKDKPLLLGIDLWEHAYYLKYQNKRGDFVDAFFHVVNWKKVDERLKTPESAS
ncbi:MAG: superoxide dismutase [Patescibacteria group bacterium]